MTREEAKSCIGTIEMLQRLAYNIHGVMDVVDADNCKNIIKALEKEPCDDCISRQEAINCVTFNEVRYKMVEDIKTLPSVAPKEKTAAWVPTDEEPHEIYECNACGWLLYDIDRADFKYCPNCGARMVSE